VFRVWLPAASPSSPTAAPASQADVIGPDHGAGERVLIVEDEPGAREGLSQVLTMLGYRVTAAATAAEATELPADDPFDLVLTDLMLPDAAGTDLIAQLRQRWPGAAVILMSGYSSDDMVRNSVATGLVRFLQKPFDMTTLAREMRNALGDLAR
jgi:DNA-binding NtrC family response regulator